MGYLKLDKGNVKEISGLRPGLQLRAWIRPCYNVLASFILLTLEGGEEVKVSTSS